MKRWLLSLVALVIGFLVSFLMHHNPQENASPTSIQEPDRKESMVRPKVEKKVKVALKMIKEAPTVKKKVISPKKKAVQRAPINRVGASQDLINKGRKIIGNHGEMIGGFPEIIARYRKTLGFYQYLGSIRGIGGRFFIRDKERKRLAAEIDFDAGQLTAIDALINLSPRSREITGESGITRYIKLAEHSYGPSTYSIILLLPLNVDYFLLAGMEEILKKEALSNRDFISFNGIYKKKNDDLILEIISGRLKNGKTKKMGVSFNLSELSAL